MVDGGGVIIPNKIIHTGDFRIIRVITYRSTNLDNYMLCYPISSDNEEKEGDNLRVNLLINLKYWHQYIWFFSVPKMCTGEGSTAESRRGNKPWKINSCVEAYYHITSAYQHKWISHIHHDFN